MSEVNELDTGHVGEVSVEAPSEFDDALAYFSWLRNQVPVHRMDDGTFVLSRYEDVLGALRDPKTFSSVLTVGECEIAEANQRLVVYCDDPDHVDLRQLVNRAWTPAAVLALESAIRVNVAEVMEGLQADTEFDTVGVGSEIAFRNFADAVGLSRTERPRLKKWFQTALFFSQPVKPGTETCPVDEHQVDSRALTFIDGFADQKSYFQALIDEHQGHDREYCRQVEALPPFLLSVVMAGTENLDEILHRLFPSLLLGGVSTVSHMFPNALAVLMEHPEVWAQLRDDPDLLDPRTPSDHLEEIFRLKSVVQGIPRVTTRDVEIRGTTIPAGTFVQLWYLSGSNDGSQFSTPDSFQLRGGTSRHLGFGFGTHTCMGQSFARLQIKLFLRAVIDKFASLEWGSEKPVWPSAGSYYTPARFTIVGRP